MKRNIFIATFLFLASFSSFGQSNSEIDTLIKNLSWESFDYLKSITPHIPTYRNNAYELVMIGKPATEKLFQSISIPEKTVVIHLILTKLYEPEKNYIYPHLINYDCEYKKNIGLHFILNGLVWDWFEKNGDYSIQQYQIDRIKSYWDKKLHDKQNAFTINPDDLFSEIQKRDSLEFNCSDHKHYKNNSSQLDFQSLNNLLFIKYPDPKFEKVFNILGTDSLCWHYSDNSFSVIYVADGIQFEFDREQILTKVFIKANYEGSLLNGITMTDNRDGVIRKLGTPEEYHGSSAYTYDWYYKKYGMLIAFGDANRIIDLQINKGLVNADRIIDDLMNRILVK